MQEQSKTYGDELASFFHVVKNDERLTATHLSIYFVLYRYFLRNNGMNPIAITRSKVLRRAKVSVATYHKRMYELHEYGYITYMPSYHPAIGSLVYLHLNNAAKP